MHSFRQEHRTARGAVQPFSRLLLAATAEQR
jgi:hypothetical protein